MSDDIRPALGTGFKHPTLEITVPSNAGPGTPRIILGARVIPPELLAAGLTSVAIRIYDGATSQYWYQGTRIVAGFSNVCWGVADSSTLAVLELERSDIRTDATGAHFYEAGFMNVNFPMKGWFFNDVPLRIASMFHVTEQANGIMGTATLVAGTKTVANTAVTANSRIYLTTQTPGGTVGAPYISARVPGTSFTISSTNAADTSTVAWLLIEP